MIDLDLIPDAANDEASAFFAIADAVDDYLYGWEGTGESSTSAADKILAFILRHDRLLDALAETRGADAKAEGR